ncbi:MAG: hypothetical protein WDA07_12715 [Leucobacter sp.]
MNRTTRFARPLSPGLAVAGTAAAVAGLLVVGCVQAEPAPAEPVETVEPVEEETPVSVLESFDFGNADWLFVPHTETYPPQAVSLADGTANIDGMQYTVVTDEVLFSDADGDGDLDAIVPVEAYAGGNSVDRQWYIWAEHDGEAVQVEMPVARTIHCGTVTANVTAVDGGFEIHEFRHIIGDENLACTDRGSDERVRTVGISDQGPNGMLWPVQLAPFPAYGGICPASAEPDTYPLDRNAYAVPNSDAELISADGMHEWQLASWSIYSMTVPDWRLIGISTDAGLGCAWVNR